MHVPKAPINIHQIENKHQQYARQIAIATVDRASMAEKDAVAFRCERLDKKLSPLLAKEKRPKRFPCSAHDRTFRKGINSMWSHQSVSALAQGFSDPVHERQKVFQHLLAAMAHPGRVFTLQAAPAFEPLHPATMALCHTLLDVNTVLWLDGVTVRNGALLQHLRFHCGCPITFLPQQANFAVVTKPVLMPTLECLDLGTEEFPERSTTLIVQAQGLIPDTGRRLRGPGIETQVQLDAPGLPEHFWEQASTNQRLFPRGVDFVLSAGRCIAALPRSLTVEN